MTLAELNTENLNPPIDAELMKRLQNLVIQNPELERLERLLDRFNAFEAIGAVRQEVRHSEFLAFLLNPRQNHGLSDLFLKRLLQEAIAQANQVQPITPIDVDIWDLIDVEIRREWQSIDILILDGAHHLAVIIENKIYTGEHSNQLTRYRQVVKLHYHGYRTIGLLLSPEGDSASDPTYISISYTLICKLIEDILQTRESTLGQDVFVFMKHYSEMLRRHIVGNSEIEILCQQIYRKHQRALDLIFEYRPDQQAAIRDFICDLITADPNLVLDHSSKTYIYFVPKQWDSPVLQKGQGWTSSGRMLLFVFANLQDSLKLTLALGPGPATTRERLFKVVSENEPPFKRSFKALGSKFSTIYVRNFLTATSYREKTTEDLQDDIKRRWNEFLDHELPKLISVLTDEIKELGEV